MFHRDLIAKINGGRCCVLVAAGPSCELGYPSWRDLAVRTYDRLREMKIVTDSDSYEKYLSSSKYAELFRQIERDLGNDRGALVGLIRSLLISSGETKHGSVYSLITSWPFACYLTTNYDDEIEKHLSGSGSHYTVIRNRREDFHHWHDGASQLIQKLHSDLNHPGELILTSADYQKYYTDDSGGYYRQTLCAVFAMFDILIIGHSLSDPDIQWVLDVAKGMRSPARPIYFLATGFAMAEEQELVERYNIVLVQYANPNGDHAELRRLLRTFDGFILSRRRRGPVSVVDSRPDEEVEAAVAIYLYRHLQGLRETRYLSPLILFGIHSEADGEVAVSDICALPVLTKITKGKEQFGDAIADSISDLTEQGLVTSGEGVARLTDAGRQKVGEYRTRRAAERQRAYGQFRRRLKEQCSEVSESDLRQCERLAEGAMVASFARRGSMVANKVFSDQGARAEELTDIFGHASEKAALIDSADVRIAFMDAFRDFLVEPTEAQRGYLASVTQGYFLYHLLGLDPRCGETRREIFGRTLWFCDSSVILPLIARGCHIYEYSRDLFKMLREEDALLATTPKLMQEAWEHLEWAEKLVSRVGVDSDEFRRAASVGGSYRKNLFVDGFIRLNAVGEVGRFEDYLELVLGDRGVTQRAFEKKIVDQGIRVIKLSDLKGFEQEDWGEVEASKGDIQSKREERGTYRGELQVASEAEIWVVVQKLRSGTYGIDGVEHPERTYFVSQSRIIDLVFDAEVVTTWAPEALYRYVASLPGRAMSADLLHQCMLGEYFYAGLDFVDRQRYEQFFGPMIDAAKASFERQRKGYIRDLEEGAGEWLDEAFARTPELEKPLFVSQMGWESVDAAERREEMATRRAMAAEKRVQELELERDRGWKALRKRREEEERRRLRNLQDPKHVRKRQRQAKNRRRKKG